MAEQLPGAVRATVTYSRVTAGVPAGDDPSGRIEPRLDEIPAIPVEGPIHAAGEPADLTDFVEDVRPHRKRSRVLGLAVAGIFVVGAATAGVFAYNAVYTQALPASATSATAISADPEAEIASLRQQIETMERQAAQSAEEWRQKTDDLRRRLTDLEETQETSDQTASGDSDVTPAPAVAPAVASVPVVREAVPEPVAPVALAPPPVPKPRPAFKETKAVAPADGVVPDDQSYVKRIESILATAPPDAAAALPGAIGATDAAAPDPADEEVFDTAPADGPIPPEPIPDTSVGNTGQ